MTSPNPAWWLYAASTPRPGDEAYIDEVALAALVLWTTRPTDRALAGWNPGMCHSDPEANVKYATQYITKWRVRQDLSVEPASLDAPLD